MRKRKGISGVDSKGYLVIKSGPHRDVRVHRLVAEAMLGRELKPDEDVHHKDGNKLNCSFRNLQVLSHAEHGAVSTRQHWYFKTNDIKAEKEWNDYFDADDEAKDVPFEGQF